MATIAPDVPSAYQDLKIGRKHRFIVFTIDNLVVKAQKIGDRNKNWEDLVATIPGSNCRYIVYDYEYKTSDGRQASKLYLIFWKPLNSNDQDKVLYAQTMPKFMDLLTGVVKATASEEEEIEELLSSESR
ncbi:ADF-H domain-containing protein [Plasmodiophora brassicae]|uniref:ADF-H domain-containing protein n=2 Tax=Plasmodiophora brassicae TaxID=37360 RepID=A0A3P3Y9A2_PLABS|nr:unnamed protein product [Plasmodiophora brassicae]